MNLNLNQVLNIIGAILGVMVVSTASLTELFGQGPAKTIVAASGLIVAIVNGVNGVISGQASQLRAVAAMPGVEPIKINTLANKTAATLAVDPSQDKIEPAPGADQKLEQIAKGA